MGSYRDIFDSLWKSSIGCILTQPVAMQGAELCIVWSFCMVEFGKPDGRYMSEKLINQSFLDGQQCLLLFAPRGTCKCFHDGKFLTSYFFHQWRLSGCQGWPPISWIGCFLIYGNVWVVNWLLGLGVMLKRMTVDFRTDIISNWLLAYWVITPFREIISVRGVELDGGGINGDIIVE